MLNRQISHSIARIKTQKQEIRLQILLVFVVPILLIKTGVIPLSAHVPVLVAMVSIFILVLLLEKWTPRMLGLRTDTLKKYLWPYLVFTAAMVVLILIFGESITKTEELAKWWSHKHFIYLFFVVSLFQELAYRGYLVPALGKLNKMPIFIVSLNVVLFTSLHLIFPNPVIGLPVAAIGGLGFVLMYLKYPNLILIILSHSVLNFFAVLYGFFVIPGITY